LAGNSDIQPCYTRQGREKNYESAGQNSYVVWAVIPVKPLKHSKMRLAHLLTAQQRANLIAGFLGRTLQALAQTPDIASVLVVTCDPAVEVLARQYGAQVLPEREPEGLNPAVQRGVITAVAAGAQAVLILPADLPFITQADVAQMLATLWQEGGNGYDNGRCHMTICADAARQGTNALLLFPCQKTV
jgi:2-phospho-L-lactate/phosphoenolpyruvate guanylyltransferase